MTTGSRAVDNSVVQTMARAGEGLTRLEKRPCVREALHWEVSGRVECVEIATLLRTAVDDSEWYVRRQIHFTYNSTSKLLRKVSVHSLS